MKKIIEISESEYVYLFLNNIVIKKDNEKFVFPIDTVDVLIFENDRATISIPVINELVEKKVNIIICKNHLPQSLIIPYSGYYNNKIFQEQIKWDIPYKTKTWQEIIKLKIQRSISVLKSIQKINSEDEAKMWDYFHDVQPYDTNNREGHAAKLYFKLLFGKGFIRDQDGDDNINILLNYGYIVLLSYVARIICGKGLDNRLGIYHKSFNNNFPLACDLMEPYRYWVDQIVYNHINAEFLNFQDFKEALFKSFSQHIEYKGKHIKFSKYMEFEIMDILNLKENYKEITIESDQS
ncbi:type II CRISPR-associated endonuclease Cas1 [Mesomycoplasma ovipneumoniae]|uniref:type II CRISPR-associated endonuclease Cas1 n=1 Tax=Mesomycoplasma ovipneumoniae TaxID=29562 RepID=UPI0029640C34|nr:type II CRISPR-associated endonuclease Cas1 [Mesomycoplasma ovipneumoniae]MDW2861058.1 type II CRISPR-associated endonuclease Cas1 [Mesomycoplasma ovipneumoniae]